MRWLRKKWGGGGQQAGSAEIASYRERVNDFWAWWTADSDRILKSVDEEGGRTIQPDVSAAVNRLSPKLGWVFGPAPDGVGHSFTLSPEGDVHKRFLVQHWLSKAPELPPWTFYPSRQPSYDFGRSKICVGDVEVGADSLWITPSVDVENEEIDITAWSPTFADISREQAMQILFLYLDEALGEEGTERCIGAIDLGDGKLDRAFPLTELPEQVDDVFEAQGWNRQLGGWGTFKIGEPLGDFPRGDIFVGSTQNMKLLNAYFKARGPIDDPLPGSGAAYVFLQLPRAIFPTGGEVDFRAGISDAIEARFEKADAGIVIGGAMGQNAAYIDLLLFDPQIGRGIIEDVLEERELHDQCQQFPFAK